MDSLGFLELIDSMSSAPPESSGPIVAEQNKRTDRRESWMREPTPPPPPPSKRHRNDQMQNFDQGGRNSYQDEDMDGNWGGNNSRNERGWNSGNSNRGRGRSTDRGRQQNNQNRGRGRSTDRGQQQNNQNRGRGRSTDRGQQQNNQNTSNRGWEQNRNRGGHNDRNLSSPHNKRGRSQINNQMGRKNSWREAPSANSFDNYSQHNNYQASRSRGRNQTNRNMSNRGRGQNSRNLLSSKPDYSDPWYSGGGTNDTEETPFVQKSEKFPQPNNFSSPASRGRNQNNRNMSNRGRGQNSRNLLSSPPDYSDPWYSGGGTNDTEETPFVQKSEKFPQPNNFSPPTSRGRNQNNCNMSNRGRGQKTRNLLSSPPDYSDPWYSGGGINDMDEAPSEQKSDDYPGSRSGVKDQNNGNMSHRGGNQNVNKQQNKRDHLPSRPDYSGGGGLSDEPSKRRETSPESNLLITPTNSFIKYLASSSRGKQEPNQNKPFRGQDQDMNRWDKGRENYEISRPTENLGRFGHRTDDIVPFQNEFNADSFVDEEYIPPTEPLTKPDWTKQDVVPIEKDNYKPSSILKTRKEIEVQGYRQAHQLYVGSGNLFYPIQEFTEYTFPPCFLNQFNREGLTRPTPLQAQIWPIALSGKNIVCIDEVGLGRILSYMIPALIHINHQPSSAKEDGPMVIILAPTRNVVQQIYQVSLPYVNNYRLSSVTLCRGVPLKQQMEKLLKGAKIVIATPDWLVRALETRETNLARTSFIVLNDTSDILENGLGSHLQTIFDQIRPERQTVMFTKAWSGDIQTLSKNFIDEYIRVYLKGTETKKIDKTFEHVQQKIEIIEEEDKIPQLMKLMQIISFDCPSYKVVIVVKDKKEQINMVKLLKQAEFNATDLLQNEPKNERLKIFKDFLSSHLRIVVGTNVSFNGIPMYDVTHVIHFEFPAHEVYKHWIRVTNEAELKGFIYSFFTSRCSSVAGKLVTVLKESNQYVHPLLEDIAEKNLRKFNQENKEENSNSITTEGSSSMSNKRFRIPKKKNFLTSGANSSPHGGNANQSGSNKDLSKFNQSREMNSHYACMRKHKKKNNN